MRSFLRHLLMGAVIALSVMSAGLVSATVNIVGTPMASTTIHGWGNAFLAATGIGVSYVEALEEVSTTELFVGLYDMAVVEYPLNDYRLRSQGLVQFPLLATGVAVVANLPGITPGVIRLNASVLAAMYMGRITNWDDSRIAELNHGLILPHLDVVPVAQSDGAAVTLNFTRYLASGFDDWRRQVGLGSGLIWPMGPGEKDAAAAAKKLLSIKGAVGFQPWVNVERFDLPVVLLYNAYGAVVKPGDESFRRAFKTYLSQPHEDFSSAINMKGSSDWPIMAVIHGQMKLIPEDVPDAMETLQMLKQVLQASIPPGAGLISVNYDDIATALNQIQTSKQFGPPSKRKVTP